MSRLVYAVDVTATMISIARVTETPDGNPVPELAMVPVPVVSTFTPQATWRNAVASAEKAFTKVTGGAKPELLILAKQRWQDPKTDPSAQRRLAIQVHLEDRLHRAGVPIAEFPYPTALTWMLGHAVRGTRETLAPLTEAVTAQWGLEPPTFLTPGGKTQKYPYRMPVVALAGVAAMAAGIETSVPVTGHRLELLNDRGNRSVQWPPELKPPATLTEWHARHEAGVPARAAG
jgi:hypothetical protein